jgi:hypothetical protein
MLVTYWPALFSLMATAAAQEATYDSLQLPNEENLRFMRSAEAVFVFPWLGEDHKHLRLLGSEARQQLLLFLSDPKSWSHDLETIIEPVDQSPKIGLVFRRKKDELVLFFSGGDTVHATFHGHHLAGVLEAPARNKLEDWKQRFARRELATK